MKLLYRYNLLIFIFITPSLFSRVIHQHHNNNAINEKITNERIIKVICNFATKNSFISVVSINGTIYLVKQKQNPGKQMLAVVRDALAAHVAECLNIAHKIEIIDDSTELPGKTSKALPATLHTLALGQTIKSQKDSKYSQLRLRQLWSSATDFHEKGLTHDIITCMTWHWQLPMIVALDLMIGNSGRHGGNLCYDAETDLFCAIDMDNTFNKDLCALAYEKIKMMVEEEDVIFTIQELKALQSMTDTLALLVQKHTPESLIAKLHSFLKSAGFKQENEINHSVSNKLFLFETTIHETHQSAQKLIDYLDTIIRNGLKDIQNC